MDMTRTPAVRKAWYAGTWYAAEPEPLRSTIIGAIDEAEKHDGSKGSAFLAVLPHAGLTYSARGIAHLLLHVPASLEHVLIISPSHHMIVPDDTLSFGLFSGYDTPLGRLGAFRTALEPLGPDATLAIEREHAVEMVMPFLATCRRSRGKPISSHRAGFPPHLDGTRAADIAPAVSSPSDGRTMIIASSDFTHYATASATPPSARMSMPRSLPAVRAEDLRIAGLLAAGEPGSLHPRSHHHMRGLAGATIRQPGGTGARFCRETLPITTRRRMSWDHARPTSSPMVRYFGGDTMEQQHRDVLLAIARESIMETPDRKTLADPRESFGEGCRRSCRVRRVRV